MESKELKNQWQDILGIIKCEAWRGPLLAALLDTCRIVDVVDMMPLLPRVRVEVPHAEHLKILMQFNAEEWIAQIIKEQFGIMVVVILYPPGLLEPLVPELSQKVITEINEILCHEHF